MHKKEKSLRREGEEFMETTEGWRVTGRRGDAAWTARFGGEAPSELRGRRGALQELQECLETQLMR
jgi:hypothetical protein